MCYTTLGGWFLGGAGFSRPRWPYFGQTLRSASRRVSKALPLYHHLPSWYFMRFTSSPRCCLTGVFICLGVVPLDNYKYTTLFVVFQHVISNFRKKFLRNKYCKITKIGYNDGGGGCMIKFRVKVMLAMRELTQKELAERTGVRPPTVSAICTGTAKHIPVNVLDSFCKALDCQPGDIMEYVEDGDGHA